MSNLSNLYISESYYGVVNLIDSTEPFASQSEGRIYLTDGLGENLGVAFDYTKRVSIDNGLTITGSLLVSGSKILTGSLDVLGDITASGTVSAGTGSFDTINARKLNIIIESSSVIFSSGSNVLGDEDSDTQTFNGSVYVPHLHYLAGNPKDTNLRIDEKLSTSSFDSFSSSLHTEQLQQDQDLVNLSSSVDTTILALSSSISGGQYIQDGRITALENFSSSLQADFVTDAELAYTVGLITSSFQQADANLQSQINTINDATSSFATLAGGNTFTGTQTINDTLYVNNSITAFNSNLFSLNGRLSLTGSMDITGSVNGNVTDISIVSSTASLDCSLGNFFTLELPSGSTQLTATNIEKGQTITLRVIQPPAGYGALFLDSTIKEPLNFPIILTAAVNAQDVITFVSFDTGSLYGVSSLNFI